MMTYDEDVMRRLKRMEGQVRGVLRMMEEGKNCKDVITQLSAVRSAADKAMAYIVAVITSYSIHYTKLYESHSVTSFCSQNRGVARFCWELRFFV